MLRSGVLLIHGLELLCERTKLWCTSVVIAWMKTEVIDFATLRHNLESKDRPLTTTLQRQTAVSAVSYDDKCHREWLKGRERDYSDDKDVRH